MQTSARAAVLIAACALPVCLCQAQPGRGGGAWNTAASDAQRSSWSRTDSRINLASMPGFTFLWKLKVANDPRQNYSLSSAVTVDTYIGYRGFRSYAFIGGAANNAVAIDTDMGRLEWLRNLGPANVAATPACPGAMSGGITRPVTLAPVAPLGPGRAAGRGGGAASGVGEPGQGAVTIGIGGNRGGGGPGGASGGRGGAAGGSGGRGGGFSRPIEMIYLVSTEGMLHTLYISNGTNAKPPVRFLPANANASGMLLVDGTIYAATSGNCGSVPNGIWTIDTTAANPTPHHWATNGGGIAGTAGPALGSDATVYAATTDGEYSPAAFSDSLVALETKTLRLKDWFTPGKSEFISSPAVFPFKVGDTDRDLLAVANKNGRLYLLDSAALGGSDHKSPLASVQFASSASDAGALATWIDPAAQRWVLVSTGTAIAGYKVILENNRPTLQQGWISSAIASPLAPIVVNGIVFTAAPGVPGKSAVLYALNGETGKELFNSGTTIAGSIPRLSGLAASAGQLYLSTADNTVYAFGIPLVPPDLAKKN